MVTQGRGAVQARLREGGRRARLVAEHTNLKRCASIGHISADRAKRLREAGIQRVHHNVETSRSYYPEVTQTVKYEGRIRTIEVVKEAGLETCVGGILNLGETREQRVEMAFELAAIDPTLVLITCWTPPGTKFGDRDDMDPREVVEVGGDLPPDPPLRRSSWLAGARRTWPSCSRSLVKAGVNGVIMGNFLTTLGNEPAEDRAMFEDLGLNVARQPDNGVGAAPGSNGSGPALAGETPDARLQEFLDAPAPRSRCACGTRRRSSGTPRSRKGRPNCTDIAERLAELDELGLYRRLRMVSGPAGTTGFVLDGRPVLLLCSNNYLGLADHPRVLEAARRGAGGRGAGRRDGSAASLPCIRRLEQALPSSTATRRRCCSAPATRPTWACVALVGRGEIVLSDELESRLDHRRLPMSPAETVVYEHGDVDHGARAWPAEGRAR